MKKDHIIKSNWNSFTVLITRKYYRFTYVTAKRNCVYVCMCGLIEFLSFIKIIFFKCIIYTIKKSILYFFNRSYKFFNIRFIYNLICIFNTNINLKLYLTRYNDIILSFLFLRFFFGFSLYLSHSELHWNTFLLLSAHERASFAVESAKSSWIFHESDGVGRNKRRGVGRISSLVANIKISK